MSVGGVDVDPKQIRVGETVMAAVFDVVMTDEWPVWDHYVALFEKPAVPAFVRLAARGSSRQPALS